MPNCPTPETARPPFVVSAVTVKPKKPPAGSEAVTFKITVPTIAVDAAVAPRLIAPSKVHAFASPPAE